MAHNTLLAFCKNYHAKAKRWITCKSVGIMPISSLIYTIIRGYSLFPLTEINLRYRKIACIYKLSNR